MKSFIFGVLLAFVGRCCAQDRILSGYFCPTCPANEDPNFLIRNIHQAYNVVNIAFVNFESDGTIVNHYDCDANQEPWLCNNKNFTMTREMISFLQNQGRRVLISIGGGAGSALNGDSPASFAPTLADGLFEVIKDFGFDGFDWDIEHFVGSVIGATDIMDRVNEIIFSRDPNLLITAAPQVPHLYPDLPQVVAGWNMYVPMASRQGSVDTIAWIQPQLYNNFFVDPPTYTAQLVNGFEAVGGGRTFNPQLRADQVVLGFPASRSAAGSGYEEPSTIVNWVRQADAQGNRMLGVMTWSIGWDFQQNWYFAQGVSPIL